MSRKRNILSGYPPHIDPRKLPTRCYWDRTGKGHWYTVYETDAGQRRTKIAGPAATMAELHTAMERRQGQDVDNLIWLGKKFKASVQYTQIAPASRKDWDYCARVVESHPSKRPGLLMGKAPLPDWSPPIVQKLIDEIAGVNGPSTAAHCARYLRRVFGWGVNRGHVRSSPVGRLELPKERKLRRLPELTTVWKLVSFAKERGELKAHTKGSCPPFIWKTLVIAYRGRLRGVEAFDLSDASVLADGLLCARRKGSNDNVTRWCADLRIAVEAAQAERAALWAKLHKPVPMKPEDRPILVSEDGNLISQSSWQSAWRRFMVMAIAAGVITKDEVFGLHDMKRRGITDTRGGKAAKLEGGGHKSVNMLEAYDFELAVVDAAGNQAES